MNKYLNPKNYLRYFRKKMSNPLNKMPWLTSEAIEWLNNYLKKDMIVFEWGSGSSTIYISKRVKKIFSIEHDPKWHKRILKEIKKKNILNCELILKEPQALDKKKYISGDKNYKGLSFENYCKAIDSFPNKSFDLVIVDGRARPWCIFHALNKVKNKTYLILDDSDRKRYSPAINMLKNWDRKDFVGHKPHSQSLEQTSIFRYDD